MPTKGSPALTAPPALARESDHDQKALWYKNISDNAHKVMSPRQLMWVVVRAYLRTPQPKTSTKTLHVHHSPFARKQ